MFFYLQVWVSSQPVDPHDPLLCYSTLAGHWMGSDVIHELMFLCVQIVAPRAKGQGHSYVIMTPRVLTAREIGENMETSRVVTLNHC